MAVSAHDRPGIAEAFRGPRATVRAIAKAVDEHDILTYASAIAFQILSGVVPFLLFGFALIGCLNLDDVWLNEIAPTVKQSVSPDVYKVIASAVDRVLHHQQAFWLTIGAALTLWEVSGAVRAVMGVLDRIYGVEEDRTRRRRFLVSFELSIAVGACFILTGAILRFAPRVLGLAHAHGIGAVAAFAVRYGLAAGVLTVAVGLLVRHAPACHQPWHWVSRGSLIIVGAWLATSTAFGFYLVHVAEYGSIFGELASVFVLLSYLYMSAVAFLLGVQFDAMTRRGGPPAEDDASGRPRLWTPEGATPRPEK
ncbi:MAG: YihY/virulence factor BrkB family protein [Solirubrobacteraceae bacterium]